MVVSIAINNSRIRNKAINIFTFGICIKQLFIYSDALSGSNLQKRIDYILIGLLAISSLTACTEKKKSNIIIVGGNMQGNRPQGQRPQGGPQGPGAGAQGGKDGEVTDVDFEEVK